MLGGPIGLLRRHGASYLLGHRPLRIDRQKKGGAQAAPWCLILIQLIRGLYGLYPCRKELTNEGRLEPPSLFEWQCSQNQEAPVRALTCRVRREIFRAAVRQCRVPLPATRAMVGMALLQGGLGRFQILLGHRLAHLAHHVF